MIIASKCIFDSVRDDPFGGYIIVAENQIVKVAEGKPTAEELAGEQAAGRTVIDCGNRTVMPGFCDNHVHVFLGALAFNSCNLAGTKSEEEAAESLYRFDKCRDDEWAIAFGWSHYDWADQKLPSRKSLDRFFPDKPVIAVNDELHALWVNSRALEICGVDKGTPDPPFGRIKRNEKGEPDGYILEQSAMRLFSDRAFVFGRRKEKALISGFIDAAHSQGVTSVGDMEIIGMLKDEAYFELEKEGKLSLRIFFSPSISKELDEFLRLKSRYASDNLALLGAKGFIDGTPLGYTGMLVEPYAENTGFYGKPVVDLEWLREKVKVLNRNGIPVRFHACGDGAVREALDDIEAARKDIKDLQARTEKAEIRNTIEHIETIHPDDLDRFRKAGTIASIQPYHMSMDSLENHPVFRILGEERSRLAWPAKTLTEHGARVALGTDCPIVPLDPFQTLYCAVNRVMEDGQPEGGWNPKEKYTLSEAIKGCTAEVSWLLNKEKKIGTLEAGKLADIIILTENLFELDPMDIRKAQVKTTIFNGNTVYERMEQL